MGVATQPHANRSSAGSSAGRAAGEVVEAVADRAKAVDAGEADPRDVLRDLAHQGSLDHGVAPLAAGRTVRDVRPDAHVLDDLAQECMTTAFVTWAHRMVLDFFARGERSQRADELFAQLRSAERVGVTAMATGMKALAGLEPLAVRGRREDDRLVVEGTIPWASNLVPGAIIVMPIEVEADTEPDADAERIVAFVPLESDGVEVRPVSGLLALDATASGSIRLSGVEIPDDAVLSPDFAAFATAFRPTFLLLQTALALGLARRSVAEAERRAERVPGRPLMPEVGAARAELDDLTARGEALAADVTDTGVRDLLTLRLDAALLASTAARVESATAGGAGYLATSGSARRLREAAFFPVQSPSEGQLRWEISSLDSKAST